jgi:AcrR family transcriptional regulator
MVNGRRRGGRDSAQTRRRIVDATVALHEEVGPAATSISAIAERAGVQRLTVYRHFPDERSVIDACSAHWSEAHPLPDAAEWAGEREPRARLEAALQAIYAYYRRGEPMLAQVLHDEAAVPALAEVMTPFHAWFRELAGQLSAGWGVSGRPQKLLRAAVGHALRFDTWRSLAAGGLTDAEAVTLMSRLVKA